MKKYLSITAIVAMVFIIGIIISTAGHSDDPAAEAALNGMRMKEAVQNLMTAASDEVLMSDDISDNTVMTVMGECVSKEYFAFRVSLYDICGAEDPVGSAVDLMKEEAVKTRFAKEHNLMPTDEQIRNYSQQMRSDAESDPESYEIMRGIVTSMGLTEDEYWNVFKPTFEAPFALIDGNVNNYCEENNIALPDVSEAEVTIVDQEYLDDMRTKLM